MKIASWDGMKHDLTFQKAANYNIFYEHLIKIVRESNDEFHNFCIRQTTWPAMALNSSCPDWEAALRFCKAADNWSKRTLNVSYLNSSFAERTTSFKTGAGFTSCLFLFLGLLIAVLYSVFSCMFLATKSNISYLSRNDFSKFFQRIDKLHHFNQVNFKPLKNFICILNGTRIIFQIRGNSRQCPSFTSCLRCLL